MQGLIGLVFLLLLAAVLVGPVLSLVILGRIRRAELRLRKLDELEQELLWLRTRVEKAEQVASTRAEPSPEPAVEPATKEAEPETEPVVDTPPPLARTPPAPPIPSVVPPKVPPAAPTKTAVPPPPPRAKIDWERWLGVRGAAVMGAVALGLAGLLFFRYSIERGLITPTMRVILGTLTGLGCLVGAEQALKRNYRYPSEALSGAGVMILYAAFWAAHVRYGLIGMFPSFLLMILVTAACCLIAVRNNSLLVAVLGLVGGFATPLLLSSGSDRPIGLFGYVLLLDLGLLAVGHKRRWASLGILSLLGTVLLQALWIGVRMGPDRLFLGLVILAVFAALFAFAGRMAPEGTRRTWLWGQAGAILFPFAFALYFAGRVELGEHVYPIAILLALLGAAACWVARQRRAWPLSIGAATASVAVIGVWLIQHPMTQPLAWEAVVVAVVLGLVYHLFVERDREVPGVEGPAPAAWVAAGGFFALLLFAAVTSENVSPWPWVLGWAALVALLYRHAAFPGRGALQIGAASGLGLGLSGLHLVHHARPTFPSTAVYFALLVAATIVLHVVAVRRLDSRLRRYAFHAAAALPVVLLTLLAASPFIDTIGPEIALGSCMLLGVLAALAAMRLGSGRWYAAAAAATVLAQAGWVGHGPDLSADPAQALRALILLGASVLVFTAGPFLVQQSLATQRFAWYAAALAGPAWFLPMKTLFEDAGGSAFIGLLPVALGAVSLAATSRARGVWPRDSPMRLGALVWFAAVALGFVSVAIPLQLDREWVTLGWALEGFAVIALWKRLDHPGLKYFGLLLLGAATVRLVFNPALLGYYPRSSTRILNWLLYTYLVPAAALLGGAALLRPLEVDRLKAWERKFYGRLYPIVATAFAMAAILVTFVWINLAIADWFSTGTTLTLSFGTTPAQRLTVSIAWAVYALILLGIGMAKDSLGLRWVSLCFLLVTIGKVFLYDLGALKDLYRVASLVGLSFSLLFVSFLYQRFVFRKNKSEAP